MYINGEATDLQEGSKYYLEFVFDGKDYRNLHALVHSKREDSVIVTWGFGSMFQIFYNDTNLIGFTLLAPDAKTRSWLSRPDYVMPK